MVSVPCQLHVSVFPVLLLCPTSLLCFAFIVSLCSNLCEERNWREAADVGQDVPVLCVDTIQQERIERNSWNPDLLDFIVPHVKNVQGTRQNVHCTGLGCSSALISTCGLRGPNLLIIPRTRGGGSSKRSWLPSFIRLCRFASPTLSSGHDSFWDYIWSHPLWRPIIAADVYRPMSSSSSSLSLSHTWLKTKLKLWNHFISFSSFRCFTSHNSPRFQSHIKVQSDMNILWT